MKLSVLTPTYNRADLLGKLYQSMVDNICHELEVEWLIMDDGSDDQTKKNVQEYQKQKQIDIQYFEQSNQGKMQALNNLMPYVNGDLIVECDSDDYFAPDAFKKIAQDAKALTQNNYALCYWKEDSKGKNIGKPFSKKETTMFDLYFKQGENGEKALVYQASIRKQFQYQVENAERFVTEARLHHKMDLEYTIITVNEPIMICEYRKDGYTQNMQKIFKENPYGQYAYFKELFNMNFKGIYFSKRLYVIKHYILFSVLTNQTYSQSAKWVKGALNRFVFTLLYLPGKYLTKRKFRT